MGVHVGSLLCHLHQPQVANLVGSSVACCPFRVALGCLSSGLAGNGCRSFLGCQSARAAASTRRLALGDVRNGSRCNAALACGAIYSAGTTTSTRVGGNVGTNLAAPLRHVPN